MNILDFEIIPSPSSNDYQIRFFVDNEDWLGDYYLGIDPHEFFAQDNLLSDGQLLIGRCDCGCVGCDDYFVNVERSDFKVRWTSPNKNPVEFKKEDYDFVIDSAKKNTAWEDNKRAAERIIAQVFIGTFTEDGYKFDWASARIKNHTITLSFSNKGLQKLIEFRWNEESVEDALITAKQHHSKLIK